MKKIIPVILLLISCMNMNAQAFEFGLGISPIHIEGTQISTYEDYSGPTLNYVEEIQPATLPLFNVNLGLYFNLLNRYDEFSAGVLYQSIFTFGKTSIGGSEYAYGLDLPVFACLRFGYTGSQDSRSAVGAGFGGGVMYSMLAAGGESLYNKKGAFMPALQGFVIIRGLGGLEITSNLNGYQSYYTSNTGPIPGMLIRTLHVSIYANFGEW